MKEKYIEQLLDQNDEFKANLERVGFETFLKLKNELFEKDQKLDKLAMRKQYIPVVESIEQDVKKML